MPVKLTYAKCVIVTTMPNLICPLCGVKVTPLARHECSRQDPTPAKKKAK